MAAKPYIIALEEHYHDPDIVAAMSGQMEGRRNDRLRPKLDDIGDLRIRDMDEAGVDFQVLSHGAPSTQRLNENEGPVLARRINDRLAAAVAAHPTRFAGFAALPTASPREAADELERMVTKHGFVGAMVHGLCNGVFFDDKRFWPILERAAALDVPLYLHPGVPHPTVIELYFKDYMGKHPNFATAGWGFTMETATLAIRMVLSGALEAYPKLRLILGHMGETIPFSSWRIDMTLGRDGTHAKGFRDRFIEHFYVTTSGFFSTNALACVINEMGVDRVMFSIDYPFVENRPGTKWAFDGMGLAPADQEKILSGNARRILKLNV